MHVQRRPASDGVSVLNPDSAEFLFAVVLLRERGRRLSEEDLQV